ncbi:CoA transferase [Streptomyces sp. NBC_01511]|uniref:CoA transferase n=1 Tax=Streptomyces sp. NBC_01511 TaxID=2903889 RepID=UPI00386F3810
MTQDIDAATAHAWSALGGAPEWAGRVTYVSAPGVLPSRLPVRQLARASVGVCSLAAAELAALRSGRAVPAVRVHEAAVGAAFVSERHLLIDGRAWSPFAPLSSFWRAADGWVRTHANYPHHRARLLAALGIPGGDDDGDGDGDEGGGALRERLAGELRSRPARWIQETVFESGGLAVAVAEPGTDRWPLIESRRVAGSSRAVGGRRVAGDAGGRRRPAADAAALPAHGVRVLDLTRVIAGPVATRTLGLLGADVLRVDPPPLPEDPKAHADTGFGKRSTRLDLGAAADRAAFEALLDSADVVVLGYRADSLDRYGLTPGTLLERHPGLIVARLDAWGWTGPWRERRGFDSLVQAAKGISLIERGADGRPGVLPAQALDHSTGYLLAAAILRALTERRGDGAGRELRLSLAGTASWLMHDIRPEPAGDPAEANEPEVWMAETPSPYGRLRYVRSPVNYEGAPGDWAGPPSMWGTDPARWL